MQILLDRLLPLFKEMRFYFKKDNKQFFISLHDTSILYKKFLYFFKRTRMYEQIRMNGKSINFEDNKINKSTFHENKKLFNVHDLDVNKILVY